MTRLRSTPAPLMAPRSYAAAQPTETPCLGGRRPRRSPPGAAGTHLARIVLADLGTCAPPDEQVPDPVATLPHAGRSPRVSERPVSALRDHPCPPQSGRSVGRDFRPIVVAPPESPRAGGLALRLLCQTEPERRWGLLNDAGQALAANIKLSPQGDEAPTGAQTWGARWLVGGADIEEPSSQEG